MKAQLTRLLVALIMGFALVSTSYAETTQVKISTNVGDIELELDGDKAPETVKNFLRYVDEGFYNGTIFHRVINGFMIQGGGFTQEMKQKRPHKSIRNEADNGLKNLTGTIAMARTSAPHSATAQFFINHADNAFLDHTAKNARGWGYAVFGRVTQGQDVVDRIANFVTGNKDGMANVPDPAVVINTISRITQ